MSVMHHPLLYAAVPLLLVSSLPSTAWATMPTPSPVNGTLPDNSTVSFVEQQKRRYQRKHDIHYAIGNVLFARDIFITMRIHDSKCYGSKTDSTFVVYLGSLSYEGEFLGWYPILSTEGSHNPEDGVYEFSSFYNSSHFVTDPEECFATGGDACVPRADVIFIQYHNEPEDSWSISLIEVEVEFRLGPGAENWHVFKYEHPVLMPCASWMQEVALYQIGPRVGLFLKLPDVPEPGKWVRDWV